MINNRRNKRASLVALDCIQAWAEAFPDDVIYTEEISSSSSSSSSVAPKMSMNEPGSPGDPPAASTNNTSTASTNLLSALKLSSLKVIRSPYRHSNRNSVPIKSVLTRSTSSNFQSHSSSRDPQDHPQNAAASSSYLLSPSMSNISMSQQSTTFFQPKVYRIKSNFATIYKELKQEKRVKFQRKDYDPARLPILTMDSILSSSMMEDEGGSCHNQSSQLISLDNSHSLSFRELPLPGCSSTDFIPGTTTAAASKTPMKTPGQQSHETSLLFSLVKDGGHGGVVSIPSMDQLAQQQLQQQTIAASSSSSMTSPVPSSSQLLNQSATQSQQQSNLDRSFETQLICKQLEQLESATNISTHYQHSCDRLIKLHKLECKLSPEERALLHQRIHGASDLSISPQSLSKSSPSKSKSSSSSSSGASQTNATEQKKEVLAACNLMLEEEFNIELEDEMILMKPNNEPIMNDMDEGEEEERREEISPIKATREEGADIIDEEGDQQISPYANEAEENDFISPLSESLLRRRAEIEDQIDAMDLQMDISVMLSINENANHFHPSPSPVQAVAQPQQADFHAANISAISSTHPDDDTYKGEERDNSTIALNCSTFTDEPLHHPHANQPVPTAVTSSRSSSSARGVLLLQEPASPLKSSPAPRVVVPEEADEPPAAAITIGCSPISARSNSSSLFIDPYEVDAEDDEELVGILSELISTGRALHENDEDDAVEDEGFPQDDNMGQEEADQIIQNKTTMNDQEMLAALEFIHPSKGNDCDRVHDDDDHNNDGQMIKRRSTKDIIQFFNNKIQSEFKRTSSTSSQSSASFRMKAATTEEENEIYQAKTPKKRGGLQEHQSTSLSFSSPQHGSELKSKTQSLYSLKQLQPVSSTKTGGGGGGRGGEQDENQLNYVSPQKQSFHQKLQKFEQLTNPSLSLTASAIKQKEREAQAAASDKNVEIKFFGSQRVVVRKNSMF